MNYPRLRNARKRAKGIAFGDTGVISSPPSRSQMVEKLDSGFGGWVNEKIKTVREAVPSLGRKISHPQHLTLSPWNLGNLSSGSSGTLNVTVQLNYYAKPATTIINTVEMEGDNYRGQATEETDICCYGGPIVYVDKDATSGYDNGTSWDNAYLDLQDALNQAQNCSGITAIWAAGGTYKPTDDPSESGASFVLADGVDTYGHFGGIGTYETSISQRDFYNSANETLLDGQIGSQTDAVKYVVTAESITDLTFDGFTVTGSYYGAGILIEECSNPDRDSVKCCG